MTTAAPKKELPLKGEPEAKKGVVLARKMAELGNKINDDKAAHEEMGKVLAAQLKADKMKSVTIEDKQGMKHEYRLEDLGEKLKHKALRGKAEHD